MNYSESLWTKASARCAEYKCEMMRRHQDGQVVKALDLRSHGQNPSWVQIPLLVNGTTVFLDGGYCLYRKVTSLIPLICMSTCPWVRYCSWCDSSSIHTDKTVISSHPAEDVLFSFLHIAPCMYLWLQSAEWEEAGWLYVGTAAVCLSSILTLVPPYCRELELKPDIQHGYASLYVHHS